MLRFVVTIRLARHSAGSRIRSAAPRTARPQQLCSLAGLRAFAIARGVRFSLVLLLGSAKIYDCSTRAARRSQQHGCARARARGRRARASLPAYPRRAEPHHPATSSTQTSQFERRAPFRTSPPQELHIKATTIPDGQSVTSLAVMACLWCLYDEEITP